MFLKLQEAVSNGFIRGFRKTRGVQKNAHQPITERRSYRDQINGK